MHVEYTATKKRFNYSFLKCRRYSIGKLTLKQGNLTQNLAIIVILTPFKRVVLRNTMGSLRVSDFWGGCVTDMYGSTLLALRGGGGVKFPGKKHYMYYTT